MGKGAIDAVSELLEAAAVVDGHRPLGEHQWLDLVQGGRAGFAGLVAWEPGEHRSVGYAQVTRGPTSWALEYVVDPGHRGPESCIGDDLVRGALEIVAEEGGGHVHMWVPKPHPDHDVVAASAGLKRGRDLLQMRRPSPVNQPPRPTPRPLGPGPD